MSALTMLDVVIGLIVVYLLYSIVCSTLNELIVGLLDSRGRHLALGIERLLGSRALKDQLYAHGLVQPLGDGKRPPSHIPSATFAVALLDTIAPATLDWKRSTVQIARAVSELPDTWHAKRALTLALEQAGDDVARLEAEVRAWFDSGMDRVSDWYRRRTRISTMVMALVLCVATNADSIRIARDLSRHADVREALVAFAKQTAEHPPEFVRVAAIDTSHAGAPGTAAPEARLAETIRTTDGFGLELGWRSTKPAGDAGDPWRPLRVALGLLVSSLAVSMGAPFWFDVLKKFVNLRSAVDPPPAAAPDARANTTATAR